MATKTAINSFPVQQTRGTPVVLKIIIGLQLHFLRILIKSFRGEVESSFTLLWLEDCNLFGLNLSINLKNMNYNF